MNKKNIIVKARKIYFYDGKCQYIKTGGFDEAFNLLLNSDADYCAIGVEKTNPTGACDLLIKVNGKMKISQDYTKLENFKNDGLIKINAINILTRLMNGVKESEEKIIQTLKNSEFIFDASDSFLSSLKNKVFRIEDEFFCDTDKEQFEIELPKIEDKIVKLGYSFDWIDDLRFSVYRKDN